MTTERRRHARVELYAHVEIPHDDVIEILTAQDLSEGGVFLAAERGAFPWLVVGAQLELTLAASEDDTTPGEEDALVLRGHVVRRSGSGGRPGIGIAFVGVDPDVRVRLQQIIARVRSGRR